MDRRNQSDKFFLEAERPHSAMKDFMKDGHLKKGADGKICKITPSGYELLRYHEIPTRNLNPRYLKVCAFSSFLLLFLVVMIRLLPLIL
jgi:hypothetical protein